MTTMPHSSEPDSSEPDGSAPGLVASEPSPGAETRRVVLITGTSTGIGLATAIAAAKAGWVSVATMRDLAKADALRDAALAAGVEVDIRQLDVTDAGSVRSAVAGVIDTHGRLDAVVNNAGSAVVGTVELLGTDRFRDAMEVNFFGVVELTHAALPHLRESHGRLITISSVGGVAAQPFNEAYCAAKFAVEGFMESLHPVASTVGVSVVVIEPGAVASEFVTNAGLDPAGMIADAGPYAPALTAYLDRTLKSFTAAQSAREVADVIVGALDAENPAFRIQTSDSARAFVASKLTDVDGSAVTGMTRAWVGV